ncbi:MULTISPECIES: FxSxx-COOH cyclophane-containing RiPP peptide [unclassified Kitasatospora]|uniref:FxSxx-COOH cyclophane-containing RiPP peptide n=1 Tax=unclassified Kitasatospora TaxID=2633591 RepID=UPI002E309C2D|nr:FxSxx-COOH cyclophane-containing RiPP peptide [Kitasatospora sp. NBC_01246]
MTPVISTRPGTELTDPQDLDRGPSLAALAALGAEELAARLQRALPGAEAGRVAVAAFNSSI